MRSLLYPLGERERTFFNRLAIHVLLYSGVISHDILYIKTLDTGLGIFDGLFRSTSITHSFNLFISVIGAIVLILTTFYLIPWQKITSVFTKYYYLYIFAILYGDFLYFLVDTDSVLLLVPIVIYTNAETQEELIQKENKGMSGVYRWVNQKKR